MGYFTRLVRRKKKRKKKEKNKKRKRGKQKMRIGINLSDIEVKDGFDPIPSGTYTLRVVKGDMKPKKSADKFPYINWVLEVIEDAEFKGNKIFTTTSLHPDAITMPSGITAMWLALELPLDDPSTEDAIGCTLTAEVGQETYKKNGADVPKNTIERFIFEQ